jgi:2-methylcitrate dehydratase PrpD
MSGHPSVVIMPALFAACEMKKVHSRDFIAAYVAAVEVCAKVGRLINPQCIVLGYHPTAILGTLGAAAAAGKVWNFDAATMENALGLAATHSCGLRPQMGRMPSRCTRAWPLAAVLRPPCWHARVSWALPD